MAIFTWLLYNQASFIPGSLCWPGQKKAGFKELPHWFHFSHPARGTQEAVYSIFSSLVDSYYIHSPPLACKRIETCVFTWTRYGYLMQFKQHASHLTRQSERHSGRTRCSGIGEPVDEQQQRRHWALLSRESACKNMQTTGPQKGTADSGILSWSVKLAPIAGIQLHRAQRVKDSHTSVFGIFCRVETFSMSHYSFIARLSSAPCNSPQSSQITWADKKHFVSSSPNLSLLARAQCVHACVSVCVWVYGLAATCLFIQINCGQNKRGRISLL